MRGRCIPYTLGKFSTKQGASIYPFDQMRIGDFFESPRNGERTIHHQDITQMRLSRAAYNWATRQGEGRKFSVTISNDHFVRCERIA